MKIEEAEHEAPETKLTHPKARKDHKCTDCGKKIPRGDHYWRLQTVDEYPSTLAKTHSNCLEYHEEMD